MLGVLGRQPGPGSASILIDGTGTATSMWSGSVGRCIDTATIVCCYAAHCADLYMPRDLDLASLVQVMIDFKMHRPHSCFTMANGLQAREVGYGLLQQWLDEHKAGTRL